MKIVQVLDSGGREKSSNGHGYAIYWKCNACSVHSGHRSNSNL